VYICLSCDIQIKLVETCILIQYYCRLVHTTVLQNNGEYVKLQIFSVFHFCQFCMLIFQGNNFTFIVRIFEA
jgi:hypothetical protein